jgi:hypothetical protein
MTGIPAELVVRARAVSLDAVLAARGITLRGRGLDRAGPCPHCGGTDRFSVHLGKGVFNCRGCGAKGSGAVDLVQFLYGVGFRQAVEVLTDERPLPASAVIAVKATRLYATSDDEGARIARASDLWREAIDPRGTLAEAYLSSRALVLAPELAGEVIRFHAACPWLDKATDTVVRLPAMLALMRQIEGDRPTAVQRTALTPDGDKIERRMLGIAGGAAIKLDADAEVTHSLTIGEGFETCLSARQLNFRPTWALGSVAAVANFPVIPAIEAVHLLEETGDHGASARAVEECGTRWYAAGREVIVVTPHGCQGDVNDVLMKWQRRKVG